ncbi:MAG: DUF445 family protein [Firmicutes bacterium]|jgi:uncharacterized membrane protein YheB (UPF0754 family)|nr:DUF445 family protein [Bacillota bacterium]
MLYLIMGIIGALIGWATNIVAIWLLFHPRRPIRFGPWQLQGLLPRRQADIALSIGQAIERELFSAADLTAHLATPDLKENLTTTLLTLANQEIDERLPKYLPQPLRCRLLQYLSNWVEREGKVLLDKILADVANNLSQLHVGVLIESRLNSFPLENLEALSWELAGKELRYIEYAGGVLGGIIGLLQAAVLSLGKVAF